MKSPSQTKLQIAILTDARDRMNELSHLAPIEWLFCKQTGDYRFEFYKDDAMISSIDLESARLDLPNLLGILVVGTDGAFETITRNWGAKFPSLRISFKQVPEWDRDAILCAAIECVADELTLQRSHSGRAALELATYRREFDRVQRSFSRLEEYVGRHSFPRASEIFEYPPDTDIATEGRQTRVGDANGSLGRSLTQHLPVDSLGVSSVSIYVSAKPEAAAEPLRITLKAIETGNTFGEWSIGAAEARGGWVELALNCAIDEPALSLVIVVEWPMEKSGWALAIGPPHPYKEFCARTEAGEYLSAPIALRVFSSLPGVRVAPTTGAIRPMNAPHVPAKFIPYELYSTVAQVLPPPADNKPSLVFYDREIGCLTVHPHIDGLTVARLNVVVPKHAWGISAQIHLAHERASPTGFGLMVCAIRDESRELVRLAQLDSPSPSFSGWKTLLPFETKRISLVLAVPRDEQLSIYLATRQAPGLSPDFAWARFSKFAVDFLPKSLLGENETGALSFRSGEVHAGEDLVTKPAAE